MNKLKSSIRSLEQGSTFLHRDGTFQLVQIHGNKRKTWSIQDLKILFSVSEEWNLISILRTERSILPSDGRRKTYLLFSWCRRRRRAFNVLRVLFPYFNEFKQLATQKEKRTKQTKMSNHKINWGVLSRFPGNESISKIKTIVMISPNTVKHSHRSAHARSLRWF